VNSYIVPAPFFVVSSTLRMSNWMKCLYIATALALIMFSTDSSKALTWLDCWFHFQDVLDSTLLQSHLWPCVAQVHAHMWCGQLPRRKGGVRGHLFHVSILRLPSSSGVLTGALICYSSKFYVHLIVSSIFDSVLSFLDQAAPLDNFLLSLIEWSLPLISVC
jgi:hypothetical protein